jgi:hypothetical protein
MKLFLPSPRATNILLIIGFCSVGYALYLRYLVIEQSSISLACEGGLNTWLCFIRKVVTGLFRNSAFGFLALVVAILNLLRPSLVLTGIALAAAGFGIVLYNVALAGIAVALLILSLARRAPAPE